MDLKPFVVQITRTETVAFQLDASSAEDAEARYLMDGDEVASQNICTVVDSVDQGTANDILG